MQDSLRCLHRQQEVQLLNICKVISQKSEPSSSQSQSSFIKIKTNTTHLQKTYLNSLLSSRHILETFHYQVEQWLRLISAKQTMIVIFVLFRLLLCGDSDRRKSHVLEVLGQVTCVAVLMARLMYTNRTYHKYESLSFESHYSEHEIFNSLLYVGEMRIRKRITCQCV